MVASEKATIGLNEAKFGLVAPFWFMDSFRAVTGQREAEFALLNGKLYSVADAKSIGLIDAIVEDKEKAIALCTDVIKGMNKCVPRAWTMTKLSIREAPILRLKGQRRQDVDNFVELVMEDSMQRYLDAYMASLKAGGAKKKSGKWNKIRLHIISIILKTLDTSAFYFKIQLDWYISELVASSQNENVASRDNSSWYWDD